MLHMLKDLCPVSHDVTESKGGCSASPISTADAELMAENSRSRANEAVKPLKMNGFLFGISFKSRQAIENTRLIALEPSTH
jgi:hypothetical protein